MSGPKSKRAQRRERRQMAGQVRGAIAERDMYKAMHRAVLRDLEKARLEVMRLEGELRSKRAGEWASTGLLMVPR